MNRKNRNVCTYLWFSDDVWGQFDNGKISFANCFFQLIITDSYKLIHVDVEPIYLHWTSNTHENIWTIAIQSFQILFFSLSKSFVSFLWFFFFFYSGCNDYFKLFSRYFIQIKLICFYYSSEFVTCLFSTHRKYTSELRINRFRCIVSGVCLLYLKKKTNFGVLLLLLLILLLLLMLLWNPTLSSIYRHFFQHSSEIAR